MIRRICHITTSHQRNDTRIFKKECVSLAREGYDVSLIVADGLGDQVLDDVRIYDAGYFSKGRLNRFFRKTKVLYNKALSLDVEIYHFHDPDFIPYALKLIKKNKIVIYDVHEDVPKQTWSKEYISYLFKPVIEFLFRSYEDHAAKRFSRIITVTSSINNRFILLNPKSSVVCNYPYTSELFSDYEWNYKRNEIAYVGGISEVRGIKQLIESLKDVNCILNLAGDFENPKLEKYLTSNPLWAKVKYHGVVTRNQYREILANSKIGMITFLPLPNHVEAQPNKMFEYMSAGIPVIASNFPLWREIIETNKCGICVNPLDAKEISEAVNRIVRNNEEAKSMGQNGRKAIIEKFNWEKEKTKLISIYEGL